MMGFLSYYRAYIPNFSRVAQPLYELLAVSAEKTQPPEEKKNNQNHQDTLNVLIDCLTEPPILGYPDIAQPFVLHCDA